MNDDEVESLGWTFGPHVPDLVRSGRLEARVDASSRYFRPAGWRSMSRARQVAVVASLLNGDPSQAVA
jgi:hypothetical protein